ncbi:hypothetical protein TNCV_2856881 [Trichonephila clavipes]|nr:hypothetical protein TNCV_2856881 [Trichonephila clavipes]
MTRKRVKNREASLGYLGFMKHVFTIDSKPLGKRKRSLGYLGIVTPVLTERRFDRCPSTELLVVHVPNGKLDQQDPWEIGAVCSLEPKRVPLMGDLAIAPGGGTLKKH